MGEKLKKGIAVLGAAYDFFTEEKSITYYANLNDLPEEAVVTAIGHLIRTEDKCPSIAKIRSKAISLLDTAQGKRELSAGEAWKKFYSACIHADYFRKTRAHFEEAALERTAAMFTVEEIRFASDKDLEWKRRSFLAEYERQKGATAQEAENAALISRNPRLQALLSGCLKIGGGK